MTCVMHREYVVNDACDAPEYVVNDVGNNPTGGKNSITVERKITTGEDGTDHCLNK